MVVVKYYYFGKCSDGRYWFIDRDTLKYVYKIVGRTVIKYYASLRDVVSSSVLFNSLPREVKQFIQVLVKDKMERISKSLLKISKVFTGKVKDSMHCMYIILRECERVAREAGGLILPIFKSFWKI